MKSDNDTEAKNPDHMVSNTLFNIRTSSLMFLLSKDELGGSMLFVISYWNELIFLWPSTVIFVIAKLEKSAQWLKVLVILL